MMKQKELLEIIQEQEHNNIRMFFIMILGLIVLLLVVGMVVHSTISNKKEIQTAQSWSLVNSNRINAVEIKIEREIMDEKEGRE